MHCLISFFRISLSANSDAHVSDGEGKQHTAPHAQHFLAFGSRLSYWMKVKQNNVSLTRIFHHSRASCLIGSCRCLNTIFLTSLHLSQFIHTGHLSFYHLAVTTPNRRIHGQQDCLVVFGHTQSAHRSRLRDTPVLRTGQSFCRDLTSALTRFSVDCSTLQIFLSWRHERLIRR